MKTKFLIIFNLFVFSSLIAQSPLERNTARIINDYRKSRGLQTLTLDTGLAQASRFHIQFEAFYDTVCHIQFSSFKGQNMRDPGTRIKHFTKNNNPAYGNEITSGGSRYIDSVFLPRVRLEDYLNNLENKIVNGFISSSKHHEALISPKADKMGICIYTDKKSTGKGVKIRYFCVITFIGDDEFTQK